MKINETHITAAEARDAIREKLSESIAIQRFMNDVKYNIENKNNNFKINVSNIDDDLTDLEIKYIESLGYEITWNGACMWYEVSFSII